MKNVFWILTSLVLFVACGDDRSSAPKGSELPGEVADMDELKKFECGDDFIGEKVYVKDLKADYECDGDHWFVSYDQRRYSSSSNFANNSRSNETYSGNRSELSSSVKSSCSSAALSSSVDFNAGSEYDEIANTLKDLRDGQVYRTVKIGKQVWTAENLNFASPSSYCYNDSVEYCAKYGRLYDWFHAICPKNWHVPTDDEFEILFEAIGGYLVAGKKLKANDWVCKKNKDCKGTDEYFFSALPSGCRNDDGNYRGLNSWTRFWSASHGSSVYNSITLFLEDADVAHLYHVSIHYACPVRCVKDDD